MPITEMLFEGPPIRTTDIEELEGALGVSLPDAYRAFLLQYNGGRPSPEDSFGDEDTGSMMAGFYAVKHERASATIVHQHHVFQERIPEDLLPIGEDMGSNQICLGIGPRNHGGIFLWLKHDEARPGRPPWRRNIRLLAKDFDEFLAGFRAADE